MDIHQAATLLQSLRTLHRRHLAPDLTIVLDDEARTRIPVHKALVAMFSGYFRKLLEDGELAGTDHHVNGIESGELMLLVDFMYTGSMGLSEENYARVMAAAKILQIPFAIEECENFQDRSESSKTLASLCEGAHLAPDLHIIESTTEVIERTGQEIVCDNPDTSDTLGSINNAAQGTAESTAMLPDGATNNNNAPLIQKRRGRKQNLKVEESAEVRSESVPSTPDRRRSKRHAARTVSTIMTEEPQVNKKPKMESKIIELTTVTRSGRKRREKMADFAALSVAPEKLKRTRRVKTEDTVRELDGMPEITHSQTEMQPGNTKEKNGTEGLVLTNVAARVEPETAASYGRRTKPLGSRLLTSVVIHPKKTSKCEYCKKLFLWHSSRELHMRTHGCIALKHRVMSTVMDARASSFVILPHQPGNAAEGGPAFIESKPEKRSPVLLDANRDSLGVVARHEYTVQPGQLISVDSDKLKEQSLPTFLAVRPPSEQKACGSKQMICSVISGKFKGRYKVYLFLRNEKQNYVCGFCGRAFPLYSQCRQHVSSRHCVRHRCPSCRSWVATQKALLQHRRLMHADKPQWTTLRNSSKLTVECSSCNVEFKGGALYAKHSCIPVIDEKETVVTQGLEQRRKLTKLMVQQVKSKGQVRFSCAVNCKRTSNTLYLARIHAIHKHKKSKLYHKIKQEYPQVSIPCLEDGCRHDASSYIGLTMHIKASHPEALYNCPQCSYETPVRSNIPVHIKQKHPGKVACDLCGKTYSKLNQLTIHKAAVHDIDHSSVMKYPCPVDGCAYTAFQKSCLVQHMGKHDTEKRFSCYLCGLKLKSERNLEKHKNKIHLGIRPYICDQCGANYGEASELKTHMMRHAPTNKFKCEHCSYKSDSKGSLKSHMWSLHRMVLDGKQTLFTCDICGYTTDRKTRSREHYNSHKNVRNYQCKVCGQTFVTNSTLLTHTKWKHQDKKLKCDFCDHQTGTRYHLKEHVRIKHTHRNLKPYKCPYCEFHCATGGNCRKHVMNRHKGKEVRYDVIQAKLDKPSKELRVGTGASESTTEMSKPNASFTCMQVIDPSLSYLEIEQPVTQGVSTVYSQGPTNRRLGTVQTSQSSSGYGAIHVGMLPEIEVQVFDQSTLVTTSSLMPATDSVLSNHFACQAVYGNSLLLNPPVGTQHIAMVTDAVYEASSGSSAPLVVLPPSAEHAYYGTAPPSVKFQM